MREQLEMTFQYRTAIKTTNKANLGTCNIKVLGNAVIVSPHPENKGESITGAAEHIAQQAAEYLEIQLSKLIWIEHYPPEVEWNEPESYFLTTFKVENNSLKNPSWMSISVTEAWEIFTGAANN